MHPLASRPPEGTRERCPVFGAGTSSSPCPWPCSVFLTVCPSICPTLSGVRPLPRGFAFSSLDLQQPDTNTPANVPNEQSGVWSLIRRQGRLIGPHVPNVGLTSGTWPWPWGVREKEDPVFCHRPADSLICSTE